MKYIPTIYKSVFRQGKNLSMHQTFYLPRCGGTYIEKGRFKAFYTSSPESEEMVFEQGTVLIPGFYKSKDTDKFIELPRNHYLHACKHGWNLTALEERSVLDCVYYPFDISHPSCLVNETTIPGQGIKIWDELIDRIPMEHGPLIHSAVTIETTKTIQFPFNWFMVVVNGKVLINGIEKEKRKWLVSSKNQMVTIENMSSKPSLIFLLE